VQKPEPAHSSDHAVHQCSSLLLLCTHQACNQSLLLLTHLGDQCSHLLHVVGGLGCIGSCDCINGSLQHIGSAMPHIHGALAPAAGPFVVLRLPLLSLLPITFLRLPPPWL